MYIYLYLYLYSYLYIHLSSLPAVHRSLYPPISLCIPFTIYIALSLSFYPPLLGLAIGSDDLELSVGLQTQSRAAFLSQHIYIYISFSL